MSYVEIFDSDMNEVDYDSQHFSVWEPLWHYHTPEISCHAPVSVSIKQYQFSEMFNVHAFLFLFVSK